MKRKPALWFPVAVVLIDALGMSVILPVLPDLIEELTASDTAHAALIGGVLAAVYALNQFLFGPLVGALSDRYGRRPLILASLAMLTLDHAIMAMSPSIWLFFIGRFLAGMAGASYTVASAYIADITPPGRRAANFGLVGAAFGVGFVAGPALGGLASEWGLRAPLWVATAISAAGFLTGLVALPESLAGPGRPVRLRDANPLTALMRAFRLTGLGGLLVVHTIIAFADFVYPALWAYWGSEVFGWDPLTIGATLTAYGLLLALVQGGLIRAVLPALGERRTAWLGLAAAAVAFLAFGLARETWMVFAAIPVACIAHFANSALMGLMSNAVPDAEQGALQGVLSSIGAVASVASSLAMTALFFALTREGGPVYAPGGPFLLCFLLALAAMAVFARTARR